MGSSKERCRVGGGGGGGEVRSTGTGEDGFWERVEVGCEEDGEEDGGKERGERWGLASV